MERRKLDSVILYPKTYINGDNDYVQVTEWTSGEGYDIDLNGKTHISLHETELDSINYCVLSLRINEDEDKDA